MVSMNNKYVRLLIMSLVIIMALFFIQDFGDFLDENAKDVIQLGGNPQCNSAISICSASIINDGDFQRLSFSINNGDSAQAELAMTISAIGFDFEGIESLAIRFVMVGTDLEKGPILFAADKTSNQVVAEKWHAVTRLPKAPDARTDWVAIVRLKSTKKEYKAEFPVIFQR